MYYVFAKGNTYIIAPKGEYIFFEDWFKVAAFNTYLEAERYISACSD